VLRAGRRLAALGRAVSGAVAGGLG